MAEHRGLRLAGAAGCVEQDGQRPDPRRADRQWPHFGQLAEPFRGESYLMNALDAGWGLAVNSTRAPQSLIIACNSVAVDSGLIGTAT